MSASTYRLPTHASPLRYDIQLEAEVGREDFSGHVLIAIELHQAHDTLDLHARELTISNAALNMDGHRYSARLNPDPDNERIILQFSQVLPAGSAFLELSFQGKVSQNLRGLYLSQNPPEQLLCTQSAITDARAIFPCFDEPTFKAQFAFEITTPDPVVLTNSPLLKVTNSRAAKTWKFAPTKTMSSYLVAMVIGDLASSDEMVVSGVPLRVWALRGKEQLGKFAVEYATRLLPWYEDYFGMPYHFDKYDQVAVPGFAFGAMENSGLVVFRQELLLMSAESSSWKQEKHIARVVAHEFAHMWFGNLVTLQWWDDLWLNEAFAEWISLRVVSEISPEYRIWEDFLGVLRHALEADALESTHAIYSPVQTPAQAQELFDTITYLKGCSVLRMLENFLGSENFREGLRTYMKEFAERNACGSDLWNHLQAASRLPVKEIMGSWILQGGYPSVTAALERLDGGLFLRLSQKRFLSNPKASSEDHQLWQIPLVVRYADDSGIYIIRHILAEATGMLELPVRGELYWCTLNADQIGFYRQNPDDRLLEKMLSHLEQLTAMEQMGLLVDQWALMHRGDQKISRFLDVLTALVSKTGSYTVLAEVVETLHVLERTVDDIGDLTTLNQFRRWVSRLFHGRLKVLGFEPRSGEAVELSQQRVSVIHVLGLLAHDPEVIAQAGILAEREAADPQSVDPNIAEIVVAIHARFGDEALFRKYVEIYQRRKANSVPPQWFNRYVYNLPTFRSPELVAQTLRYMEAGIIPREAVLPILTRMLSTRHAQHAAWQFIKENWLTIKELGIGTADLIKAAGYLPYSMRNDLIEFCNAYVRGFADMSYGQALETMDLMAEFQARTRQDLVNWLNESERH